MAKVTPLGDSDHIIRHVAPARLRKDEDGNVLGVNYQAFELRDADKGALSCAWVEYFDEQEPRDNIAKAKAEFKRSLTIRPTHRFVLGNVGRIRNACQEFGQRVRISHEPELDFDSHATVRQIDTTSVQMLELLAAEAWAELLEVV